MNIGNVFKIKKNRIISVLLVLLLLISMHSTISFAEKEGPKFDAVFIGDQTVLGMQSVDKDKKNLYIGEEGKGITWLRKNNRGFIDRNMEESCNAFYILGFNEVQNTFQATNYANYLNAAAKEIVKIGGKVFYVSINPIDAQKAKIDLNPKIDEWNKLMNEKLSKDIKFIDSNSYFKKNGFKTLNNGYDLNEESNKAFVAFLLKQVELQTYDEKMEASKPKPIEKKNKNGWGTDKEGKPVYYDENQKILKNGLYELEGGKYLLDENGYYKTGLQEIEGRNYYFNSVGVMKSGWVSEDNENWMLFSEKGPQLYGWQNYEKHLYYIGKDGYRLTGWWNLGTTLHYFNEDGTVGEGITPVENEVYFFADRGSVKVGWIEKDGNKYYFGDGGPMVTGKQTIAGSVYYFTDDGKMYTGLRNEKDGIRYYNTDGTMVVGNKVIDGVEYTFDEGGLMKTGYVTNSNGETLYITNEGKLANGLEKVEKEEILFKDGKIRSGWYTLNDKQYYFDLKGKMVKNTWKTISGNEYYFDESGLFLTGKHNLEGYICKFNDKGVLQSKFPIILIPLIIIIVLILGAVIFALTNKELTYEILGDFLLKLEGNKNKDKKPVINKEHKGFNLQKLKEKLKKSRGKK